MLSRTKRNLLKATTLTLALTALAVLGADLARADTYRPRPVMDETRSEVFPAIYQENEDSCFVQVGANAAVGPKPQAPAYMDSTEYESLAYGCGDDDATMTVLRGARSYAWSAR